MKKFLALLMVVAMLATMLIGCGKSETSTTDTGDAGKKTEKTAISVCLASEPDTIDPALNSAVDGATMIIHAFSGLVGWRQDAKGALELYADCAKELPEGTEGEDGKVTYVFELRDGLKWSDGTPITAEDFVYSWNRAVKPATTSDYAYMFDIIDRETTYTPNAEGKGYYNLDAESGEYAPVDDNKNPDGAYDANIKLNVTATDEKTLTVVIQNRCTYFFELLAFPTYMPVQKAAVEAKPDSWATDPSTYICNGAYTMTAWEHNSKIVYTKNPDYYNADKVTVDEITFYLSDDQNAMLANFKTGAWQFIDDVPQAEIKTLEKDYPDEYNVEGQLGTYYVIFNVNKDILPADTTLTGVEKEAAEADVRKAISLLLDRTYICEEIGQAGQVPAASFVGMGLTDSDNKTQFIDNAGNSKDYKGYYDVSEEAFEGNVKSAVETLKKYYTYDEASKKFTDVPSLEYIYNTNDGHKAIAEYLQAALAEYGITLNIVNQEWNTFLNTRKNGEYNIARNGWLADYNDPMSFLDMWTTASGNNDAQFGRGDHGTLKCYSLDLTDLGLDYKVENGTWAETYDYLVNAIKTTTDTEVRYKMMHKLEDLLMETGAICPLYYYTDIFMNSKSLKGMFTSPLGYKYFMYATLEG